jgi:CBS domain-containing protein
MRLKDIMSTRVESVRPGELLAGAEQRMRSLGIHHLVVVDRQEVVGLLSEAALQARIAEGVGTVEDAMFRHVVTATPDTTVTHAARMMRSRPEGALPVFAGKRLVGIVTTSDLLDVLARRPKPAPAAPARRLARAKHN